MKIMINGAGGMLGEAIYRFFEGRHCCLFTDLVPNTTWLTQLDFRCKERYQQLAFDFQPDIVLHLGAHTDLEYCERNIEDAYLTNGISVEHAVEISDRLNSKLVFVSTAGIFDGRKDFYDELDIPNPLGIYARSKFWGERAVLERCNNSLVVRAGWMMGGGEAKDKKFVGKIMRQIKSGQETLRIVDDKLGTPTYTHDFARNLELLIRDGHTGLFNMVSGGFTSRLEVANEIVKILGSRATVVPVSSSEFPEYFAPRPNCERLLNRRLDLHGLNLMRGWKVALEDYLKNHF